VVIQTFEEFGAASFVLLHKFDEVCAKTALIVLYAFKVAFKVHELEMSKVS